MARFVNATTGVISWAFQQGYSTGWRATHRYKPAFDYLSMINAGRGMPVVVVEVDLSQYGSILEFHDAEDYPEAPDGTWLVVLDGLGRPSRYVTDDPHDAQ